MNNTPGVPNHGHCPCKGVHIDRVWALWECHPMAWIPLCLVSFVHFILIRAGLVYSFLLLCNFLIVWLYHCLSGLPLMDVWETSSLIVMNNGILNHVVHSLNSCGDRPDSDTIMVMETHMLLWMLANSWTIYMNWEDMNWDFWCLHTQWYPQSVFR